MIEPMDAFRALVEPRPVAKDKDVSALNIKVDTDNIGVVQLNGAANTKTEAEKALAIARSVEGVTSVKNDIRVQVN